MHPAHGLKPYLDQLVGYYERPSFIDKDPIAVCHAFGQDRDQEIVGLFAALLAWGRRATILDKVADLCARMDYRPFSFVRDFDPVRHAFRLQGFRHRTFSSEDAIWLTANLRRLLRSYGSLEAVFAADHAQEAADAGLAIEGFTRRVMGASADTPARLRKHLARPLRGSAAKRLCMYLRWMVRPGPVDLGLWKSFAPSQLVLPLDVHSGRQARALGALHRSANDWRAALELTRFCRSLCEHDPARYDFAFFGLGITGGPPAHIRPPAPLHAHKHA